MHDGATIEPVPDRATGEAIRFLVGGLRRDIPTELRAEAFERIVAQRRGAAVFRWALRGGRCVGAALVVAGAGRVGMAYYSPLDAPGVAVDDVAAALSRASRDALAGGLSFVQALAGASRRSEKAMLAAAGLGRLAELVYLRRALAGAREDAAAGLQWRAFAQLADGEMARVIQCTYANSLDCPGLYGLREMADVIAGHQAGGVFTPASWWVVDVAGIAAGCILVNDSSHTSGEVELVYMGVAPAYRGRGLGRAMVRRAAAWAARAGKCAMNVAADSANSYATRIYRSEGFREVRRRDAYIVVAAPAEARER